MIKVVNKYKHTPTEHDVYIGRGSPFGSPFSHLKSTHDIYKVDTREEAIDAFKTYLERETSEDTHLKRKLDGLRERTKTEDINLVCFCKPKACHGDVIKEYLEDGI